MVAPSRTPTDEGDRYLTDGPDNRLVTVNSRLPE